MVGDRRLVSLGSGNLVDDEACKMVALGSQAVFGFTGLANMRPPPRGQTGLWLADLLTPPPARLNDVAAAIGDGAAAAFAKVSHLGPRAKRHTFVGAGWQTPTARCDFEPFFMTISSMPCASGLIETRALWRLCWREPYEELRRQTRR